MGEMIRLYEWSSLHHNGCKGLEIIIEPVSQRQGIIQAVNCCPICFKSSFEQQVQQAWLGKWAELPEWFPGSWYEAVNQCLSMQDEGLKGTSLVMPSDVSFVTEAKEWLH